MVEGVIFLSRGLVLFSTMQNTESGRKINQAVASTGRAVATTSKAVGKYYIIVTDHNYGLRMFLLSFSHFRKYLS